MRYVFSLSDDLKRQRDFIEYGIMTPVELYEETEEIQRDFDENPVSDWWYVDDENPFVYDVGDFNTKEDAIRAYYKMFNESVADYLFDL